MGEPAGTACPAPTACTPRALLTAEQVERTCTPRPQPGDLANPPDGGGRQRKPPVSRGRTPSISTARRLQYRDRRLSSISAPKSPISSRTAATTMRPHAQSCRQCNAFFVTRQGGYACFGGYARGVHILHAISPRAAFPGVAEAPPSPHRLRSDSSLPPGKALACDTEARSDSACMVARSPSPSARSRSPCRVRCPLDSCQPAIANPSHASRAQLHSPPGNSHAAGRARTETRGRVYYLSPSFLQYLK